jgi:hypothetical protein
MNTTHPFDLVIGLDRSDRKADLYLIDTHTAQPSKQIIDTAPERLHDWLAQLRQQYPTARVGLCLEQPAVNLILFLETYAWITLYAINPVTLQKFREAFVTSRAKDDGKDAVPRSTAPDSSRQIKSLAARRHPDPPVATTGRPSPGGR